MNPEALLRTYAVMIGAFDEPDTWHMLGMLVEMRGMLVKIRAGLDQERGRFNRWLGFVQAWLYKVGLRTIDQLREETRGIDEALAPVVQKPAQVVPLDASTFAGAFYNAYALDRGWDTTWGSLPFSKKAHWLAAADAVLARAHTEES